MQSKHTQHSHQCPVCGLWIKASNAWGNCPRCDAEGFKTVEDLKKKARKLGKHIVEFNGFKIRVRGI